MVGAREHGDHLSEDRGGAGDEVTGSASTGHIREDRVVAAELMGITERQMRWRKRLEEQGPKGLLHPSWASLLMLGATDFYQRSDIPALQVAPDDAHMTIDVPNMAVAWSPQSAPLWQWLKEPWTFSVPSDSEAVTDLDALRGFSVTEACRWEENYWELFAGAGPEVPKEEKRVVGLGMLLAADPSLAPILDLKIGDGIWREDDLEWHVWETPEAKDDSPA